MGIRQSWHDLAYTYSVARDIFLTVLPAKISHDEQPNTPARPIRVGVDISAALFQGLRTTTLLGAGHGDAERVVEKAAVAIMPACLGSDTTILTLVHDSPRRHHSKAASLRRAADRLVSKLSAESLARRLASADIDNAERVRLTAMARRAVANSTTMPAGVDALIDASMQQQLGNARFKVETTRTQIGVNTSLEVLELARDTLLYEPVSHNGVLTHVYTTEHVVLHSFLAAFAVPGDTVRASSASRTPTTMWECANADGTTPHSAIVASGSVKCPKCSMWVCASSCRMSC